MAVIMPHSAFIHVPKTGGTWCRAAIKQAKIKHFESGPNVKRYITRSHASLSDAYESIMQRNWRNDPTPVFRYTFGFVRNPLTWLESRWADAIRKYGGVADHDISNWFKASFSQDFSEYIDNVIRLQPDAPSRAMLARLGFHKEGSTWVPDKHPIDFIGQQERLVDDFITALTHAGEKFDEKRVRYIPPQRVASKLDAYKRRIRWTAAQRDAIYEANTQLFNDYGYAV